MSIKHQRKTKEQLINELSELRIRLNQYEGMGLDSEDQVFASENKYRALIDNLKDIVFTFDLGGNITFASGSVENILGYTSREITGTNLLTHIPEEDAENAIQEITKAMGGKKFIQFEVRTLTKSGEIKVLELSGSRLWKDDKPVGALGVLRDITQRKRAQAALNERGEIYHSLFVASSEGIMISDFETQDLVYANPALCKMLGYSEDEFNLT